MNFAEHIWKQLRSLSCAEIVGALERDGWVADVKKGSERIYRHPSGRRVSMHYHAGSRTYGRKLLQGLLEDIGWSEQDMRRLKLIK